MAAKTLAEKNDMTTGGIFGKFVAYALPFMLTNLLQVLYNAADIIVVGLSGEPDAVGAVGTTTAFVNLIVGLYTGIAVGSEVVISRAIGRKDDDETSKATHTSVLFGLLFGAFCGLLGFFVARPVLSAMGNGGKLLSLATSYTQIYFVGLPVVSLTNFAVAVLHAEGDSRTPFIVLTISGIANVVLNLFFVLVCGMSVEGVAIATVAANAISAVALIVRLFRDKSVCRLHIKKMKIHGKTLGKIVRIGLPAAVQSSLFSLSNMLIQSSIVSVNNSVAGEGAEYQPIVKANSAGMSIEAFIYTAIDSVGKAAVSFVGQNSGAGKTDRLWRFLKISYAISFTLGVALPAIVLILRNPLLALYGIYPATEGLAGIAYDAAITRMLVMFVPYFTIAFMQLGSGILQGLGKSVIASVSSLIGACLFRVVWIFTAFAADPTLFMIYVSYPISWTLVAATHFIVIIRSMKRMPAAALVPVEGELAAEPVFVDGADVEGLPGPEEVMPIEPEIAAEAVAEDEKNEAKNDESGVKR